MARGDRDQDNKMSREEAGRLGGEATAESHDRGFYEDIGSKGGENSPTQFKAGDERTKRLASEGGKASGGNRDQDD